jgi:hypothetical protein
VAAERQLATGVLLWLAAAAMAQEPAAAQRWQEIGRQGITRLVIVPMAQARDREAYTRQIALLCQDEARCFINFYTNSTGATLGTPLPDAVWQEPTAVYRLSDKRGAEQFRWACRLGLEPATCF